MWLIDDFLYFYSFSDRFYPAIISIFLAVVFLLLIKYKKQLSLKQKLSFIYGHIFFLLAPFVFFTFFRACQAFFTSCYVPQNVISISFLGGMTSLIAGMLLTPLLFYYHYKRRSFELKEGKVKKFIDTYVKDLGLRKTKVFILDSAKPVAFSLNYLKSRIFVSVGMVELLSKKELEAVLLHELGHLKNKSSVLKVASHFLRLLSPMARFFSLGKELTGEEHAADAFAVAEQKTNRFLEKAKEKVEGFEALARRV